jgi:hypothetical protein
MSNQILTPALPPLSEPPAKVPAPAAGPAAASTIIGAPSHIIPSRLSIIAEITAVNGFIKITKFDGTEVTWPAENMGAMAADCKQMLEAMMAAERQHGKPVEPAVRAQVMELCEKCTKAYFEAKHQQEAAGRYDRETQIVTRTVDSVKQQRGLSPEKGEYSGDNIPEHQNIKYFLARFPQLTEVEISAHLRATHLPWALREKSMRVQNGKRMAEELGLTIADLNRMLATGKMPFQNEMQKKPAPAR